MQRPLSLSRIAAWGVALSILAIGIPLNLRTPLWCDVSLYDISAWNVLQGGVHYRDTFDTNLPGMMWIHCLIRSLFGWSTEAMRSVDLLVVGGIVALLAGLLRQCGVAVVGRVWFLGAVALFYLFESEYIQCQRDTWMLLPLLGAIHLQLRDSKSDNCRPFLIGALIGLMVWIKPHAVIPAASVYAWLMWKQPTERKSASFLRIVLAVLAVGALGGIWLIASGSLPYMLDIFLHWNPEYYEWSREEYLYRWSCFWYAQQPWSRLHAIAIPLAIAAIVAAIRNREASSRLLVRSTLGVLYLSWIFQSVAVQKSLDYVLAPGIILCLAMLASIVGRWIGLVVVWLMVSSFAGQLNESTALGRVLRDWSKDHATSYIAIFPNHSIFETARLKLWPQCVAIDCPDDVRDRLPYFQQSHTVPAVRDQRAVVAFLRSLHLNSGDLVCWNDSTHPIYRELGLKPGLRYLHFHTALSFESKRGQIRDELIALAPKYVVGDIAMPRWYFDIPTQELERDICDLPDELKRRNLDVFPWNQKVVFHSGRYYVFEVVKEVGKLSFEE